MPDRWHLSGKKIAIGPEMAQRCFWNSHPASGNQRLESIIHSKQCKYSYSQSSRSQSSPGKATKMRDRLRELARMPPRATGLRAVAKRVPRGGLCELAKMPPRASGLRASPCEQESKIAMHDPFKAMHRFLLAESEITVVAF